MKEVSLRLASFPRSGSNWLLELTAMALGMSDRIDLKRALLSKNHFVLWENILGEKCIYLYRHPKDAFLSYARFIHWQGVKREEDIKPEDFNDKMLLYWIKTSRVKKDNRDMIDSWRRMQEYYFHPDTKVKWGKDLLLIRYEEIVENPKKIVNKTLNFLGFKEKCESIQSTTDAFFGYGKGGLYDLFSPSERKHIFIGRWKICDYWTKEVDDYVNSKLGDIKQYGFEKD